MTDGSFRELTHAASAAIEDETLVCRDSRGRVHVCLQRTEVLAFSSRPWLGALMLHASIESRTAISRLTAHERAIRLVRRGLNSALPESAA